MTVEGENRVLTGNDLPVDHSTGEFPIAEFPYAVGCFHGTTTFEGPLNPPG